MKNRFCFSFIFFLLIFAGSVLPVLGYVEGDIITFGNYEQDGLPGSDPIEWKILTVENGRALLLSRYILEVKMYNEENFPSTWEDCSLRIWLNEEFYDTAFSPDEKSRIQTVSISNPDNSKNGTPGGNDTDDKIFILDIDEANTYLQEPDQRKGEATDHAIENGIFLFQETRFADWWLRTPGNISKEASYVLGSGNIYMDCPKYYDLGVRPALLINLIDLPVSMPLKAIPEP